MKYWVTTDTHIGHKNIAKLTNRPVDYNDRILDGIASSNMKQGDVLIHLGDVAFNDTGEAEYLHELSLKGVQKWLVLGNHDKSGAFHLRKGWHWVGKSMTMDRFGFRIIFSHKPIPSYNCDLQIHGHFHNNPMRYWEGELKQVIDSKHMLMIIENLNYEPIGLKEFIGIK